MMNIWLLICVVSVPSGVLGAVGVVGTVVAVSVAGAIVEFVI